MATSTTITNSANLPVEYYERKLLSTLEPRLVLQPLGKRQKLPRGNGKQVKWLRYAAIAESTTPLTEGTPPSEIAFSTSNVTSAISQYGQFSKVSDLLSMTAIDPVLENLSERFGVAAAKTIESLIVAELDAEAADQFAAGAAGVGSVAAGDNLDHIELIKAMVSQKEAFIDPHESGQYVAVIHPKAEFDLLSDTQVGSFQDINKYVGGSDGQRKLLNGEIGRMYGMRILVSDKMSVDAGAGAAGIDVYSSYLIGEEAFGTVWLDGSSVEMKVKRHGSAGANDPLDQFATVGYKLKGYATKYLDSGSKRVIRIQHASDQP
jgi:N4-gp56 family major capsid protein